MTFSGKRTFPLDFFSALQNLIINTDRTERMISLGDKAMYNFETVIPITIQSYARESKPKILDGK